MYCHIVFCQSKYFEKNTGWYNTQNGKIIFEKDNGDCIILGNAFINNSYWWHSFNLLIDTQGNFAEMPIYYESPENYGSALFGGIETDYGFAAAGYMVGPNATNTRPFIVQLDHNGVLLDSIWVDFCDHCPTYTLSRTPDGGYMLGGSVRQYSGNNFTTYPYLIHLNEQGEVVWDRAYTLPSIYCNSCINTFADIITNESDSSYYAIMMLNAYGDETSDAMWCHIDSAGNIIDQRLIGSLGGQLERPRSIIRTLDGNWLISLMIDEFGSGNCISGRFIKLSANGDTILWDKEILYYGFISKIQELPDGSFIVGGEASPLPDYAFNATIAHVSANGDSIYWQRSYGGAGDDDYIYDFTPTSDGGYFFVGRTETNVPGANVYLLKTNCMGLLTEPQAQYSYTNPNGNTIVFQNLSQYTYPDSIDGGHYLWDFGDGFNSNEQNPTHTYAQAGIYLAKLTAIVCQDTSIIYQSICIGTSAHPAPSFTHTLQNDTTLLFTNTSSNAQNAVFIWDFGDGSPPTQTITQQTQQHSYTQAGEHQVTLSVIMCQDTTVYTQVVDTWAVGIDNVPTSMFLGKFVPNPTNNQTSLQYALADKQTANLQVYDMNGRIVNHATLTGAGEYNLDTHNLSSGLYMYLVTVDGIVITRDKLVIVK
jgi:PKD repeat protein